MQLFRSTSLAPLTVALALALAGCPKSSSPGDEKASKAADEKKNDDKKADKKKADDDDKADKKKADEKKGDEKKGDDDEKADDAKADKKKGDDDKKADEKKPLATNEADVTRYPDEKKIDPPVTKKTVANSYNVRIGADGKTKAVTALAKDVEVTQIAERGGHFLVTFANPKNKSETLMGWIYKAAFEESKGGCPAGEVMIDYPATGPFCGKKCKADKDCPAGHMCDPKFHGCMDGSGE
jgi:hypothetical protein